jgi:hypothetical protein
LLATARPPPWHPCLHRSSGGRSHPLSGRTPPTFLSVLSLILPLSGGATSAGVRPPSVLCTWVLDRAVVVCAPPVRPVGAGFGLTPAYCFPPTARGGQWGFAGICGVVSELFPSLSTCVAPSCAHTCSPPLSTPLLPVTSFPSCPGCGPGSRYEQAGRGSHCLYRSFASSSRFLREVVGVIGLVTAFPCPRV